MRKSFNKSIADVGLDDAKLLLIFNSHSKLHFFSSIIFSSSRHSVLSFVRIWIFFTSFRHFSHSLPGLCWKFFHLVDIRLRFRISLRRQITPYSLRVGNFSILLSFSCFHDATLPLNSLIVMFAEFLRFCFPRTWEILDSAEEFRVCGQLLLKTFIQTDGAGNR